MLLLERLPVAVLSALITLFLGASILYCGALAIGVEHAFVWVTASWLWKAVQVLAALFFCLGLLGQTAFFEALMTKAFRIIKVLMFIR